MPTYFNPELAALLLNLLSGRTLSKKQVAQLAYLAEAHAMNTFGQRLTEAAYFKRNESFVPENMSVALGYLLDRGYIEQYTPTMSLNPETFYTGKNEMPEELPVNTMMMDCVSKALNDWDQHDAGFINAALKSTQTWVETQICGKVENFESPNLG